MFDLARAMVAAIASAQAHVPTAQTPVASRDLKRGQDFELPRFLTRAVVPQRSAASHERAEAVTARQMLEMCRFALIEGQPGLVTIVAIAVLVLLMFAGTAPGSITRNDRADAIAARFAAATPAIDVTVLEERLDFAPRLAFALSARQQVRVTMMDGPVLSLPFDPLGAVILRGLPEGTSLSSGIAAGGDEWIVAQGDLERLQVTIPFLVTPVFIEAHAVSREGLPRGMFAFSVAPPAVLNASAGGTPLRTGALAVRRGSEKSSGAGQEKMGRANAPAKAAKVRGTRGLRAGRNVLNAPNAERLPLPVSGGGGAQQAQGSISPTFKPSAGRTLEGLRNPMEEDAARR